MFFYISTGVPQSRRGYNRIKTTNQMEECKPQEKGARY